MTEQEAVTPEAPTRCAHTREPMTWDGMRWVHQPGICEDKDHS